MKRFFRLAWLTLLMGLFIACSSPPASSPVVEEIEEAAEPAVVEAEQTANDEAEAEPVEEAVSAETTEEEVSEDEAEEEMEEAAEEESSDEGEENESEESMEEAESVVTAVDGPTHTPAATIEEALVERAYDQVKGADEPLMTIIEYGDFQ